MEGISFRLACLIVYKGTTFQKGSYAHYVTLCHILSFLSSFLFFSQKNFIFAVENYRNYSHYRYYRHYSHYNNNYN